MQKLDGVVGGGIWKDFGGGEDRERGNVGPGGASRAGLSAVLFAANIQGVLNRVEF